MGDGNIAIGSGAGGNLTSGSNNIYIANPAAAVESGVIRIGNTQTKTYIAGIRDANIGGNTVYVSTSGVLSSMTSSRRYKQDIRDMGDTTDVVMGLRPVRFRYKSHGPEGAEQFGLIAEEVNEVAPELVGYDQEGQIDSVYYDKGQSGDRVEKPSHYARFPTGRVWPSTR